MSVPEEPAVEVAYALPDRQTVVRVKLFDGMTALAAVEASGLLLRGWGGRRSHLRGHDLRRGEVRSGGIREISMSPHDRLIAL